MKRFASALAVTVFYLLGFTVVSFAQHEQHEMKSMGGDDSAHVRHDGKENALVKTTADTTTISTTVNATAAASIKDIVGYYLQLKNALVNDKTKESATAGTALESAFKKFDKKVLTPEQQKVYEDVEDDAREHAEHIGANAGNIEHQREHFEMLSKDVYDLVKAFGSEQVLYKDFCPMYDKKGAMWLSETKAIKNPYFGRKMLTCGSVQEEIK